MPVDSRHSEYDAAAPQWSRARDVLAGEDDCLILAVTVVIDMMVSNGR